MRRIRLTVFGQPDVLHLEHVPDPVPGPGQVLIAVTFAGVTYVETQVRAGRPPWDGALPSTPYYPGNGVEGEIEAVGDGVDPALAGTRVVSATGGSGGYADRVVVSDRAVIPIPAELAPGHSVALLADGRTAMSVLRASRLRDGEVALVTAAAGGVGGLLVQLARSTGAKSVIALAGGPDKCEYARSLGAAVVDYRQPGWTEQLSAVIASHGLDVAFDGVGGTVGRAVFDAMPPRSRLSVFGMSSGSYVPATVRDIALKGVTVVGGVQLHSLAESNRLSADALAAAAAGRLRPNIGAVFPLERAADAHAALESRAVIGKALLEC
jgi:NADPH:quinone reductase